MKDRDGCQICGTCWWVDCDNDADYVMDVDLKRKGLTVYSGKIELCAGHTRFTHSNGGRLDLNWTAIEQALVRDRVSQT